MRSRLSHRRPMHPLFLPPTPLPFLTGTVLPRRSRQPHTTHACTTHPRPPQLPTLPPPRSGKRPYGYWTVRENVLTELQAYVRAHAQHPVMPTQSQLLAAGRADLAGAIRRYGSWKKVADDAGLVLSSIARPRSLNLVYCTDLKLRSGRMRPYMYWRDFSNLRAELTAFISAHCDAEEQLDAECAAVIPRASLLKAAGRSDLVRAIRMHGGWEAVAARLNITVGFRSGQFWAGFDNVAAEVRRVAEEHMPAEAAGTMPSLALLRAYGAPGLYTALVRRHGGATNVARRMGLEMAVAKKPRGFWGNRDNLRREVVACVRDICDAHPGRDCGLMPTKAELAEIGRTDVYGAIERSGGVGHVAALLGLKYFAGRGRSRARALRAGAHSCSSSVDR